MLWTGDSPRRSRFCPVPATSSANGTLPTALCRARAHGGRGTSGQDPRGHAPALRGDNGWQKRSFPRSTLPPPPSPLSRGEQAERWRDTTAKLVPDLNGTARPGQAEVGSWWCLSSPRGTPGVSERAWGSPNLPRLHKQPPNSLTGAGAEVCCYENCCARRGLQPAPATTREGAEQLLVSHTAIQADIKKITYSKATDGSAAPPELSPLSAWNTRLLESQGETHNHEERPRLLGIATADLKNSGLRNSRCPGSVTGRLLRAETQAGFYPLGLENKESDSERNLSQREVRIYVTPERAQGLGTNQADLGVAFSS